MQVRAIQPFITANGVTNPGDVFELSDALAVEYANDGLVTPVTNAKKKETAVAPEAK